MTQGKHLHWGEVLSISFGLKSMRTLPEGAIFFTIVFQPDKGLHPVSAGIIAPMREIVKLESTAGTGYYYTATRNKKAQGGKLEVMKYDPKARKHVKFVEKKISK